MRKNTINNQGTYREKESPSQERTHAQRRNA